MTALYLLPGGFTPAEQLPHHKLCWLVSVTKTSSLTLPLLHPGGRFAQARFGNYRVNPTFPSQGLACRTTREFASAVQAQRRVLPWNRTSEGQGLYLDGGFGVGKTHLLVSAYFAAVEAIARPDMVHYVHFQELTSLLGKAGVVSAAERFSVARLLCIDEFELDDPGNLHLMGNFLDRTMRAGVRVIATSNTPPQALGQGRFNAARFGEALSSLAKRFQSIAIDGPDYRERDKPRPQLLSPEEQRNWRKVHERHRILDLSADELDRLLLRVHPADFGTLLNDWDAVAITGLTTFTHPNKMLREQGAIRFVHFIDKVYDLGLPTALTGVPLFELFEESYRSAAFGRKYARCLSRVSELTQEASQAREAT